MPDAPVIEVDAGPRMVELGKRVRFFPMRADRDEVDRTGGRAARGEFDNVIDAIASATLPTIVDIGANTAVVAADGDRRPGAGSVVRRRRSRTDGGDNGGARRACRHTENDGAGGALGGRAVHGRQPVSRRRRCEDACQDCARCKSSPACWIRRLIAEAAEILQAGGLASIPRLDAATLNKKYGIALGSRIRRDLTRVRLDVMRAVRLAAEWMVA